MMEIKSFLGLILAMLLLAFLLVGLSFIRPILIPEPSRDNWITVDAEVLAVEQVVQNERGGVFPFYRYFTTESFVIVAAYEHNGERLLFYSDNLEVNPEDIISETISVSFDPDNTGRYVMDIGRLR